MPLDERVLVGMCNTRKNTNTSQFFFTLAPCPKLTGKHVRLGRIIEGHEVLDALEAAGAADQDGKPTTSVVIRACGVLE